MKKKRQSFFIFFIILSALLVYAVVYYVQSRPVGSVNNTPISSGAYQKKLHETQTFYEFTRQDKKNLDLLSQDAFDKLVNETLIDTYVREKNIKVTEPEMEERYTMVVGGYNRNHGIAGTEDTRFLQAIKDMYGADKSTYLQEIRMDILKERIQAQTGMPFAKWLEEEKKNATIIRK